MTYSNAVYHALHRWLIADPDFAEEACDELLAAGLVTEANGQYVLTEAGLEAVRDMGY